RRHPDPDECRAHGRARICGVAKPAGAQSVLRRLDDRTVGVAPARASLRAFRNADDQQDAAHSEALDTYINDHRARRQVVVEEFLARRDDLPELAYVLL